jgi:hypothetical protein
MKSRRLFWPLLLLILAFTSPAFSAVDLVTLPIREGKQLTIYNSEDITMVREHRLLTVKEGVNRIQFSWANTLIDPTSGNQHVERGGSWLGGPYSSHSAIRGRDVPDDQISYVNGFRVARTQ